MGHLMRCLEFANHISEKNVNSVFLTNSSSALERIRNKGFECVQISENNNNALNQIKMHISNYSAKIILFDINYHSTVEQKQKYFYILQKLKKLNLFLITFEDFNNNIFPSDIVIIPYVGAESLITKREIQINVRSQFLLGPKFFPVRKEFQILTKKQTNKFVETILVTMGGSDPEGITLKVVNTLSRLKHNVELIVVLGNLSTIKEKEVCIGLENYAGNYEVIRDSNNIANLMNKSQLAITNSGLTKYEMAFMGLPAIVISNNKSMLS
jgi:spore coat polysaccharide biosynthesis predicted glycosyltransferase SpsG